MSQTFDYSEKISQRKGIERWVVKEFRNGLVHQADRMSSRIERGAQRIVVIPSRLAIGAYVKHTIFKPAQVRVPSRIECAVVRRLEIQLPSIGVERCQKRTVKLHLFSLRYFTKIS